MTENQLMDNSNIQGIGLENVRVFTNIQWKTVRKCPKMLEFGPIFVKWTKLDGKLDRLLAFTNADLIAFDVRKGGNG